MCMVSCHSWISLSQGWQTYMDLGNIPHVRGMSKPSKDSLASANVWRLNESGGPNNVCVLPNHIGYLFYLQSYFAVIIYWSLSSPLPVWPYINKVQLWPLQKDWRIPRHVTSKTWCWVSEALRIDWNPFTWSLLSESWEGFPEVGLTRTYVETVKCDMPGFQYSTIWFSIVIIIVHVTFWERAIWWGRRIK